MVTACLFLDVVSMAVSSICGIFLFVMMSWIGGYRGIRFVTKAGRVVKLKQKGVLTR